MLTLKMKAIIRIFSKFVIGKWMLESRLTYFLKLVLKIQDLHMPNMSDGERENGFSLEMNYVEYVTCYVSSISHTVSCMFCVKRVYMSMHVGLQARCFANTPPECSTSQHTLHSLQVHGTWLVCFVSSLFTSKVSSSGALAACFCIAQLFAFVQVT